jgi:hypothetical protein
MSVTRRRLASRRAVAALAAGATALGGAAFLAPGTGSASSHREAPYTLTDPAADNTDTYAFVSPENDGTVTLLASWSPFQEPAGGPNFFPWDSTAAYDINVDNNGDAVADLVYRWTFSDVDLRGTVDRGAGNGEKGTFLYNDGAITSLTDPDLRFRQTYDLEVLTMKGRSMVRRTLVDDALVPPNDIGTASVPDYAALRQAAVTAVPGGGHTYAGQSDDAFFLDLRIFDLLYGGDFSETGNDTLEGYNVNTLALKLPARTLVSGGSPEQNPVIGVWSTTSRASQRIFAPTNAAPATSTTDSSDTTRDSGALVQVSRLGNPLVNEAVVPAHLKDYFNRSTPDRDGQFLGKVQDPEVPALVEKIYGIPNPNKTPGFEKRPDLVAAFLTGFSKKSYPALGADLNSLDMNKVSPNAVPAEYLRLNVTIPASVNEDRAGVIGGDLAGFPNGRRLGDDVVDIALRVLEGALVPGSPDGVQGLGDGVNANDKPFLRTFPYVADPHSGSEPR